MNTGHDELTKPGLLVALIVVALVQPVNVRAQDRLPPISPEKMTEAQKKAAAEFKDARKADPAAPPWSVIMRVPDLLIPSLQMRLHNQTNSALSAKLTEFAILIAARNWTSNFEWNAHHTAAATAGLSPAIITAVADGRRPERMAEDEEIIYNFCDELLHNQSVSDPTYARALAKFGEPGIIEAASLVGYYTYLSMIMNTARSPLPSGAKPLLTPFPK
jgi:4-carboxymuconolactone decarboxylase